MLNLLGTDADEDDVDGDATADGRISCRWNVFVRHTRTHAYTTTKLPPPPADTSPPALGSILLVPGSGPTPHPAVHDAQLV